MSMFATLSHRKIKGWDHLRRVDQHNDRKIATPAREADRPMPIELIEGANDLVERAEVTLGAYGVSLKLRKNGVLAYEDIYGASPEYWDRRYPQGWRNVSGEELRQDPLVLACLEHATAMYGDKLISVRLHIDEKTPHLHVISLPLVTRPKSKRGRKRRDGEVAEPVITTTLYASADRGGTGRRLEEEHDKWSAAVAHIRIDGLGLERGKRGSDLTDEERHERRLRDRQASRQGEQRARVRAEEKEAARAAKADRERAAELLKQAEVARAATLDEVSEIVAAMVERTQVSMAEKKAETDRLNTEAQTAATRAAEIESAAAQRLRDVEEAQQRLNQAKRTVEAEAEAIARARAAAAKNAAETDRERSSAIEQRRLADADREAAKRERAAVAMAAKAEAMTGRQLALVDRAATDDELELSLADGPRGVAMNENAMSDREREAYLAPWSALARRIAQGVAETCPSSEHSAQLAA